MEIECLVRQQKQTYSIHKILIWAEFSKIR